MVRNRFVLTFLLLGAMLIAPAVHPQQATAQQTPPPTTTYIVDTNRDDDLESNPEACRTPAPDDDCTLRQAIELSNADPGPSIIEFSIPRSQEFGYDSATGLWTIEPVSALPELSAGNATITGPSSTLGQPMVVIDGSNVSTTNAIGLTITSANNTVERMIIINFTGGDISTGFGIAIRGTATTGNRIRGNYIGIVPRNNEPFPNSAAGIAIENSNGNQIGDTTTDNRNYISGNGSNGILLRNANENIIRNNFIGVGLGSGTTVIPIGNNGMGIQLIDSSRNTIGGTSANQRNVISANTQTGVLLTGSATFENTIAGNYIGTNDTGLEAMGNRQDGVRILNRARNNTISGTSAARTVISGNTGYGVFISDGGTNANRVTGGFIGLDVNGSTALPNGRGGVRIQDNASNNVIGAPNQGNVISGNTGYGVEIARATQSAINITSNRVSGNTIGLSANGVSQVPNTQGGVFVTNGTRTTLIGGTEAGAGNIISSNTGAGVLVSGTQVLSTTLTSNIIGVRRSAANQPFITAAGNTGGGIVVSNGARNTLIGAAGGANSITSNTGNGILISGSNTISTTMRFNQIGTLRTGTPPQQINLGNSLSGVRVDSGAQQVNIIDNTIWFNRQHGVFVANVNTQRVRIINNSISRNTAFGIELNPSTTGLPGVVTNPNHDIDAPFDLRLNQNRQLTGRILVETPAAIAAGNIRPAACVTCTVQIFGGDARDTNPQGRDRLAELGVTDISPTGRFTTTLSVLPEVVALTATDAGGNTSAFGGLRVTPELQIGPARSGTAAPSETITYTHRITNTGTLDFTDLRLEGVSSQGWSLGLEPAAPIELAAGESKPVTVTLTLPIGTDPRVRAGVVDTSTITVTSAAVPQVAQSVANRTQVSESFVLGVDPRDQRGSQVAGERVSYVHTLTNQGNLTGTVRLSVRTDRGWPTTISPAEMTLGPGRSLNATVSVTIPANAVAETQANSTVTIRVTDPANADPSEITFVNQTTVSLTPQAELTPFSRSADAEAGQIVVFAHEVTNKSNGRARFRLTAASSLGSQVNLRSTTSGITIDSQGRFTLGTGDPSDPLSNVLAFVAEVRVSPNAVSGDTDQITIRLFNDDGEIIALAQDSVRILRGRAPFIYLPALLNNSTLSVQE